MALKSFDDGNSDEARQFLLDRACERNHPKRHRTRKRSKAISAKKKARVLHKVAVRERKTRDHKNRVAAYWSGEADGHP